MSKSKSFLPILIPSATVFISSFCIMVLELVAGRLIARHLGSSLYTWTSVIGVVLSGITIGNYLGGRIADRFPARKALSVLFGIASAACVVTVVSNNIVGEWILLWRLSWPLRVFSHVSLVFLIPSTLLGMISPVVAKMALDRGLPTGRTVGDIYAWGAAGSIAGTFAAGFYLIATMGTIAIVWTVGAALLLLAILYWARLWVLYLWAVVFVALMTMGMAPGEWTKTTGSSLALREKPNPNILYEDESQYCYIAVKRLSGRLDRRAFMQDKLMHSEIIIGDINNLQFPYTHIYAAITRGLSRDKDKLNAMIIGGGGYVYPRYIEKNWPNSRVDVVEIDPGVTEAAMQAFGLERDTTINTINMDARNYVDELLEKERNGKKILRYDFIYEDAVNDYSVPYQLVTKEFDDKIAKLLTADGVYMVNLIDIFDSGLFLGAIVNTLQETFPYVHVITTTDMPRSYRNTFVVIAAKRELDLDNLTKNYTWKDMDLWHLNESDIAQLKAKSNNLIITDNYAPVENLMAPVVRKSAVDFLSARYLEQAKQLQQQGKLQESLRKYEDLIKVDPDPTQATLGYNEIALILAKQGKTIEAIETLHKALKAQEEAEIKKGGEAIHFSLGILFKETGKTEQAKEHLNKAIDGFREKLVKKPNSVKIHVRLGDALAENGNFKEASEVFTQAVALNPFEPAIRMKLVQSLEFQGRIDEAIVVLQNGVQFMSRNNQPDSAMKFKKYIEYLEHQEKQSK